MGANGERIGGIIGTIRSVKKILNDFRPSNVLVVWDGEGGSQRRKQIYQNYKSGRSVRLNETYEFGETPEQRLENMRHQRTLASDYLTLLGIPQVRAESVEADDLIAYVAGQMDHPPDGCVIVTTDQDMLQLVRTGGPTMTQVSVWSPIKKVLYDRDRFISEYGVIPENFRLVKAMTGDKSDNIEGVKGLGIKTVAKMFPLLATDRMAAVDVLAQAELLKSTLGNRLVEQKDRFLENLRLVDLSSPMLSASAARLARDALVRDVGCRELELRMRMVRDGTSIDDDRLCVPFKEFMMRRRKALGDTMTKGTND